VTKPTIAERGWLGIVIDDHLRPALKDAESIASDLDQIELCDRPGCGLMFDRRDARHGSFMSGGITYRYCPACEIEAKAVDRLPSPPKAEG
jgi:hypothetical protein